MNGVPENQMFDFAPNASQPILTKKEKLRIYNQTQRRREREKRAMDPEYRERKNLAERLRSIRRRSEPGAKEKSTDYARRYRTAHPEYAEKRLSRNLTPEKLKETRLIARTYQKMRREKTPEAKEKIEQRRKEYRASNPDRRIAWQKVSNSVAYERLHSPPECQSCGSKVRLHAHHPDYSKPLEVKWLCPLCHFAVHRGEIAA